MKSGTLQLNLYLKCACHNVGVEPTLKPLSGETFRHVTISREDEARLDVVADTFGVESNVHFLM